MKKTTAILFLILLAAPLIAFAATPCVKEKDVSVKPEDLPRCVNQVYIWSLGAASLLALLMIIIGGYYYMTASGNAERSSKGIEIIWSSVIGLAILFGAYLLLNTINPDLVNFKNFTNDFNNGLNQTQSTTTPTAPRTP